jgi:hypothetical protein
MIAPEIREALIRHASDSLQGNGLENIGKRIA